MIAQDWRDPEAYAYIATLDAADLAFEFLRRNPDYQNDFDKEKRGPQGGSAVQAQGLIRAHRWGLASFRRS